MQVMVKIQICEDHHFMVNFTKICFFSVIGGEKFQIKTAGCRYGGHGTNK